MPFIDSETDAFVKAQWQRLPPQLKQAITDARYKEVVARLTQERHLHIDQAAKVEQEILLVLLGMSESKDLASALHKQAGIADEEAKVLEKEIVEKVIAPVATHLHDLLHASSDAEDALATEATASTSTPPPSTTNAPAAPKPIDPYREPID